MTVADLERFIAKSKLITYIGALVKLYKQRNHEEVHKIYKIIELEKWYASIIENPYNLDAHRIIEVSLDLHSAHIISKDQNKAVFYINNHIDWDQFNKSYDIDWFNKDIQNANTMAHKFYPVLIKATNPKLKI